MVGDSVERRVEILCDRDELHITWTRFGPGRDGATTGLFAHALVTAGAPAPTVAAPR